MKCISRLDLKAIEAAKAESVWFNSLIKTWEKIHLNSSVSKREKGIDSDGDREAAQIEAGRARI